MGLDKAASVNSEHGMFVMKLGVVASLIPWVITLACTNTALANANHASVVRTVSERFNLPTLPDRADPFWYDLPYEPSCWRRPPWTVTTEAMFLKRSTAHPLAIAFGGGGEELLNVADLQFNFDAGPRFNLVRHGACGFDLEVGYFGIDSWDSTAVVETAGAQLRVFRGFAVLVPFTVEYNSRLYSTEINARREVTDWLTVLMGFRWVELHEEFNARNVLSFPPVLLSDTDNHLYGFQLGAEGRVWDRGGRLHVDGWIKAGVYHDSADVDVLAPQVGRSAQARGDSAAFLGEIGLGAEYRLTRSISLRAGYQVMWLEGVALAPDQSAVIDITAGGTLDTGGSLLYHGVLFGLRGVW